LTIPDITLPLSSLPTIDGTVGGAEYDGWVSNCLYDGGRIGTESRGIAHIGYFCPLNLLCVAAYATNGDTINLNSDQNWVWINEGTKNFLFDGPVTAVEWAFIGCDSEGNNCIGYEACWSEVVTDIHAKSFQIHYNSIGGETRSNGRNGRDDYLRYLTAERGDDEGCTNTDAILWDCDLANTDCANYSCNIQTKQCELTNAPNSNTACNDNSGCCNGNGFCISDSLTCTVRIY